MPKAEHLTVPLTQALSLEPHNLKEEKDEILSVTGCVA
jgi:hypothetical protein